MDETVTETTPVEVPVRVRVTVTRTVEVEVPVIQARDVTPGLRSDQPDWPDTDDLYDRAKSLVLKGEGLVVAQGVMVDGWEIKPSAPGDPYWRPLMFGGRI